MKDDLYDNHCRGCGTPCDYVYCAKTAKCGHGNSVEDCDRCDIEGDLAFDAAREGRVVIPLEKLMPLLDACRLLGEEEAGQKLEGS